MNSKEYLRILERSLGKLQDEDRMDAMDFYRELFDEAGPGQDEEIIRRLGSPKMLAASIRADAALNDMDEGSPKIKKGLSAVWIAILGIFAAPIALPIALAIFAVFFSLFICIVAILFSLFVTAASLALSGVAAVIVSFVLIPQDITATLFYLGGGLLVAGFGVGIGIWTYLLTRTTFRGLARLAGRIRHGRAYRPERWKAASPETKKDAVSWEDIGFSNDFADTASTTEVKDEAPTGEAEEALK
jgi:uncharacterized membrane protein